MYQYAKSANLYFFRSCMKASENSKTSLHDIIRDVGGWNLTGSTIGMNSILNLNKIVPSLLHTCRSKKKIGA